MAEGLILEFDGVGEDEYWAVNRELGVDMTTGEGDWPAGLLSHAGGATPEGWTVMEVWESRADQERFMHDRLGAALQRGGVSGPPSRMQWLTLAGYSTQGRD